MMGIVGVKSWCVEIKTKLITEKCTEQKKKKMVRKKRKQSSKQEKKKLCFATKNKG
jgi:hypothetical protein